MSMWFFGRKRRGRRALYLIGIPWPMLLPIVLVLTFLLLMTVRGCLRGG
jgi:hypothetical protein